MTNKLFRRHLVLVAFVQNTCVWHKHVYTTQLLVNTGHFSRLYYARNSSERLYNVLLGTQYYL